MIRTNLKLTMLLWYHCRVTPYAEFDSSHANSSAVREQRLELIKEGMLAASLCDDNYIITEKAKAYLEYIFSLKYPVNKWIMVDKDE